MESDDGLLFMLLRSDKLEDRTKLNEVATDILETAREVVELLGGYPLALDQAGAYIQVTGVSFTDYKKRFHKERRRLLKRRSLLKSNDSKHSRHPLPTAATLDLCINEACKGQPLASDILHFCALLQPDVIPRKLFEDDDSFKYGTTEFDEAIAALLSYSLVKRNAPHQEFQKSSNARQTFSIHRMVHAVLIDNMSPELQKQWREHVVLTLKAAFGEEYYMLGDPSNLYIDNLLSHVLAIADWTEDELTPSMEVADLHQKAGRYFHVIGKYSVAKKLLVRANSIYEQLFGAEHFVAVTALNDLACVYYAERNYVQAEPLFQQVRAMLERLLEAEHRNTVFMIINLAHLYIHQGKYEQAESLLLQTLSICENQLGDKHPDIPSCMAILVLLYFAQGKYEQAESYQERVISLEVKAYQGVLGPDTTFISQYNLALLYEKQGKYEQADLFYSREGRMFMRKLEYEYPDSHISIQGFAMFLHAQGMREQALAMRLKALHIREREQMATHLEVLRARKAYARFLNCMARYDEAQALLEIEDW